MILLPIIYCQYAHQKYWNIASYVLSLECPEEVVDDRSLYDKLQEQKKKKEEEYEEEQRNSKLSSHIH